MSSHFGTLIIDAILLTARGNLLDATATIQRALSGSAPMHAALLGGVDATVLDGLVRDVPDRHAESVFRAPGRPTRRDAAAPAAPAVPRGGSFDAHQYSGCFGTRSYKLFVPNGHAAGALPLIVMLHGCSQSPDDFAAGTRMNEVAQERGFLVLYPAQAPRSNHWKCWNWFVPADQHRDGGEPGLLAEMTRHVAETRGADPRRIYVAGLSAGAAMAVILGREYPELFAAVGVHSGVPRGAASDVASAFAVMRNGASSTSVTAAMPLAGEPARSRRSAGPDTAGAKSARAARIIVFHGDADPTVHPSNGDQVVRAALQTAGSEQTQKTTVRSAVAGKAYTLTVHRRSGAAPSEPSLAEHWALHGAGHAWSGGSTKGSYAHASGPDASREMVRFFEEHQAPGR